MQWIYDYKEVSRLYPNLNAVTKAYFMMRFLICPFGRIEQLLPKEGFFVDVGCGYGLFANLLAIRSSKRIVIGCDINHVRIRIAANSTVGRSNISFSASDVKDLKLPPCDVVTMVDLLHHVPFELQTSLIKQCHVQLNRDGLLVIKDIDKVPMLKYAWNYMHDFIMTRGGALYFVNKTQMCKFLEEVGFKVDALRLRTAAPYPHIMYICRKIQE